MEIKVVYWVEKGREGKEEVYLWGDLDVHGCEEKGRIRQEKKRTEEVCAHTERSSSWCSGPSIPA